MKLQMCTKWLKVLRTGTETKTTAHLGNPCSKEHKCLQMFATWRNWNLCPYFPQHTGYLVSRYKYKISFAIFTHTVSSFKLVLGILIHLPSYFIKTQFILRTPSKLECIYVIAPSIQLPTMEESRKRVLFSLLGLVDDSIVGER